jgi:MFS family permease
MTQESTAEGRLVPKTGLRVLATAFTVSSIGDWIYRLAFPVLIFQLTGSAISTAMAYVSEFIPYVFLGPLAGVIADRTPRRRLMIICDSTSALLAAVMAIVAGTGHAPIWLLYVLALCLASVRGFYFPAFQGYITASVSEHRLVRLNSLTQTVDSGLGLLGPLVGALAVVAMGAPAATGLNAASFAASAMLVSRCVVDPRPASASPTGVHLVADLRDGLRWLAGSQVVRWGTALLTVSNLAAYMIEGNLVYLGLQALHVSKIQLSLVFAAQGLGAVIGAATAPRLMHRYRTGYLLCTGLSFCAAPPMVVALSPNWTSIVAAWVLDGFGTSLVVVPWFTARQQIVPNVLMGRVVSASRALSYVTIPVGAALGGAILSNQGVAALFGWVAVLAGTVAAAAGLGPLARIDQAVEQATGRSRTPMSTPADG